MSRILARCHPALEPLLPPPVPAARALPDWLRTMPAEVAAPTLGGAEVRTLKHCPPFIDALGLGVLILLPTDLEVREGEVSWAWDLPAMPDAPITRAPVGVHVPEQATGMPVDLRGQAVLKFTNYWALETEPGWQLLITHPLNREDLPFRTLSGVVSTARFGLGYIHFPALWVDPAFSGTLPRGTPIAQLIAIPQPPAGGPAGLEAHAMSPAEIAASRTLQESLQAAPGVYRKSYRG